MRDVIPKQYYDLLNCCVTVRRTVMIENIIENVGDVVTLPRIFFEFINFNSNDCKHGSLFGCVAGNGTWTTANNKDMHALNIYFNIKINK